MSDGFPQRIVCLTEEPTEVLYALGLADRIVGISGFTVRPPQARKEKPKVSAFTSAKLDKILALEPDLAIGFSDMQADIARALIKAGVEVWVSNHRSVAGILAYIRRLGAMVGAVGGAEKLAARAEAHIASIRSQAARLERRPRVYFEEWDDPQISAIGWVSELIAIAGGDDIFPDMATQSLGRNRIIADPAEPARRQPDIIIGSWCGKKFRPEKVAVREGWQDVPAVVNDELHEIKSSIILQPGPAALFDGLDALHAIIARWAGKQPAEAQASSSSQRA
ncbi:MAG: cobalamin-binding protein [Rhodanobacteraceae bacterium]